MKKNTSKDNTENLGYLIPQIIENCDKLKKELRITRLILWFIAGIAMGGLIEKVI